jgi:hypothetical protein
MTTPKADTVMLKIAANKTQRRTNKTRRMFGKYKNYNDL